MLADFSCTGAGYNKTEYDDISFRWVGEQYLALLFPVSVRVGDQLTRPGAALVYGPDELRDYGGAGAFVNSYCTFYMPRELFQSFELETGVVFYPDNTDRISKLMKKISDEYNNARVAGDGMLLGLTLQLLAEFKRGVMFSGARQDKQLRLRSRFEALREEYLSNLADPPDIDTMAEEAFISRSQFHRLYKRFFGITPKSDLLRARMDYAKDLLIKTELSTADIAAMTGLGTQLNLYRSFKKYVGMTMREWRQSVGE